MEEVNVSGKIYISSKRAASICGYAQDYVGQLARRGLIDAQRIGGLWYVSLESIRKYKEVAEQYKPQPPKYTPQQVPDSITGLDGREYISAGRASEMSGYNADYIGQLARAKKIPSQQVGNRWYIDKNLLLAHKEEKDELLAAVQTESVGLAKQKEVALSSHFQSQMPELFSYSTDTRDLIPQMKTSSTIVLEKHITKMPHPGNHIPIRIIDTDEKEAITDMEAVPESEGKFLRFSGLKNPFSLPGISIFSSLYFKSAMLAVLLLTIGISLSKNDFIYAVIKQHYPQKNLLANADMGFAHGLSDTAITFLSKELVYERAGAN